jgi:hypothetical protein
MQAIEVITTIRNYGLQLMLEDGIDYEAMVKAEAQQKKKQK